jgi:16S rRNA C967 or C1407 C5-methylase (RsmB/RsmF family)
VVDAFLAESGSFVAEPLSFLAESIDASPDLGELIDERGRLRTTPARHGLDAFFAARLVRRERA